MVATIRTWNWDVNYAAAGGSFDAQAADLWFRFHELMRGTQGVDASGAPASAGAWSVHSSGDGAGTFGAGDNIASSANIVFAAAGNPHSWVVYQSPANFVPGGNSLYVCVDFNDAASPFSTATVVLFPGAPTVAGTNTARPTHTDETLLFNTSWFPTTVFAPRTFHGWRNDVGEILMVFSLDGTLVPEAALWLARPDAGETGIIWPAFAYAHNVSSIPNRGALGFTALQGSAQYESFWQDNTPLVGNINFSSPTAHSLTASWTNGRSNVLGAIPDAPIDIIVNSTIEAMYLGRIVDIRGAAENVPENETQDGDTDPVRRITCGELWLPIRQGVSLNL